MKLLVFTVNIGDIPYAKYSIPLQEKYAKRCGADYKVLTECTCGNPYFERYTLWNSKYDRILYMDADIIPTDSAPNIFEIYKDPLVVYGVNECVGSAREDHIKAMEFFNDQCRYNASDEWEKPRSILIPYLNVGVFLISKPRYFLLKKILDRINLSYRRFIIGNHWPFWQDQTDANFVCGDYIASISPLWNWTTLMRDTYGEHKPHFLHFAGNGFRNDKINEMKELYEKNK